MDTEQLAGEIFTDMWESDQETLECTEEGCYIERASVEESLIRLGYVCDEDDVWRPEAECDMSDETDRPDPGRENFHSDG